MIKCSVPPASHRGRRLHLNCLAVRIFPQFPSQLISQTAEARGGGAVLSGVRAALNTGRMRSSCSGHEARPVTSCLCASSSFLQRSFNGSWRRHDSPLCFVFPQHIWEEKPHTHASAALLADSRRLTVTRGGCCLRRDRDVTAALQVPADFQSKDLVCCKSVFELGGVYFPSTYN